MYWFIGLLFWFIGLLVYWFVGLVVGVNLLARPMGKDLCCWPCAPSGGYFAIFVRQVGAMLRQVGALSSPDLSIVLSFVSQKVACFCSIEGRKDPGDAFPAHFVP